MTKINFTRFKKLLNFFKKNWFDLYRKEKLF